MEEKEEQRILAILKDLPEEKAFFVLALESAMRMRECYTLDIDQISLQKRTVHLVRTKNGDSREVPLSSTAVSLLKNYITQQRTLIRQRGGRLFSFWNGDHSVYALDATTSLISVTYAQIFKAAQVSDFHFHDLRHEATCRLYQKTSLSDVLIARITGHRNLRMLQRYASLRGSDLADHLW